MQNNKRNIMGKRQIWRMQGPTQTISNYVQFLSYFPVEFSYLVLWTVSCLFLTARGFREYNYVRYLKKPANKGLKESSLINPFKNSLQHFFLYCLFQTIVRTWNLQAVCLCILWVLAIFCKDEISPLLYVFMDVISIF